MRGYLIVLVVVLCGAGAGCALNQEPVEVPEPLLGVWRTDDINYRGRFLELRPTSIWIGTGVGPGTRTRYTITGITETRNNLGLLYRIEYVDVDFEDYNISFYFDEFGAGPVSRAFYNYDDSRGIIRLANKFEIEWRKTRH